MLGRRYRLRNGAVVRITNRREIVAQPCQCGKKHAATLMVGYFVGHERQPYACTPEGNYSPADGQPPHYLDVVGRG